MAPPRQGTPEQDVIRFQYTGSLADSGRLNFYELGRAYYASSRLIYTVARFRETGRVISKVTERIETVILAEAPQKGSFSFEAIAFLLPIIATEAVNIPISALLGWIWDKIIPTGSTENSLEQEAAREFARLKTQVAMSREETKRMKILGDILESKDRTIEKLIEAQNSLIDLARERKDDSRLAIGHARLAMLENAEGRQKLIQPYAEELSDIPAETVDRLEEKVRDLAPEIALPLRSSAEQISIGVPGKPALITKLSAADVAEINAERLDPNIVRIKCRILRYDRTGRYGKLRTQEPDSEFGEKEYYFRLPAEAGDRVHSNVIDAMHLGTITASVSAYRGRTKHIERLVLHEVNLTSRSD